MMDRAAKSPHPDSTIRRMTYRLPVPERITVAKLIAD
jgi:hypothetical protein